MRSRERARRTLIVGALLVGAGCASHSAPNDFLPHPNAAGSATSGGWLDLELVQEGGERSRVSGELLAVTPESLWVQPSDARGVVVSRRALGDNSRLTKYAATTDAVTAWTVAGTVSTISNGVILIISAPVWVLTGTFTGANDTHAAQTTIGRGAAGDDTLLRAFSRYPQGMPRGADATFGRLPRSGAP